MEEQMQKDIQTQEEILQKYRAQIQELKERK